LLDHCAPIANGAPGRCNARGGNTVIARGRRSVILVRCSVLESAEATSMRQGLFRVEALSAQRTPWLGSIRIASPVTHAVWSIATLCFGVAVVAWLALGEYTRRERVNGVLAPEAGLIDVIASAPGTVTEISAQQDASVRAGQALVTISGEHISESLGGAETSVSEKLRNQRDRLQADVENARDLAKQQADGLRQQQTMLEGQLRQIASLLEINAREIENETQILKKMEPLRDNGYLSSLQYNQQESQTLTAKAQEKTLLKTRYETQQQLAGIVDQLKQLPLTSETKISELERQISQLEQTLATNEAGRSAILRSVEDGSVSSLLIKPGQFVSGGQTLLTIVPEHSALQAILLVPSSAIGFVRTGENVVLHYDAFPYQKFGAQSGVVESVSRNALTAAQVGAVSGQSTGSEPMYKVVVRLQTQKIRAYGKDETLKAGMTFTADLLLDDRKLIEWIMDPLYSLSGNVREKD